MFPSNKEALSVSWSVLIILGATTSSTCNVVSKIPSSSPSLSIETFRCLKNRTLSKYSWDTYKHHPSLSCELTFLHTITKVISLETKWCLSLLMYFCRMMREGWTKRLKIDPFEPTPALFFFDRGILAGNNGKLQLRNFPMPNLVCL